MLHCLTNEHRRESGRHRWTFPPSGYAPATDTLIYDALGQRVAVQQTEQLGTTVSSTTRVFSYDGDGQILSRRDGTVSGTGTSATFTGQGRTPQLSDRSHRRRPRHQPDVLSTVRIHDPQAFAGHF
jgi:hypothetical protein